ncbi:protein EFR3 [Suhomyces tanzawaensis NRRL Y-17324]|uniref:Protein EFR3 n=1 Tax=Suhomyces tanzawaensis NRRL Y-17324 TaxID=984487 RepID=A0A1E4SDA0_9ASCO|nr:protein EFR3 [Suhomyces tanzawaensis NRRL Y-17324]ODV77448.1 protein EFR3 [Suhomyces tanzawaensis NRRL Y-17324]
MFIHSKHQKLILQCYPPGKGVDKKPNPSELSYLLYYASTRRVKLEKVANFLEKRNQSDVSRNRAGNLQVTLAILAALIDKCSDDLNVFASHVCTILHRIAHIEDLALAKSVLSTYGVFCHNLNNALFPGDGVFMDLFSKLSESLVAIGMANSKAQTPHQLEWKMTALMASRHLANCIGHDAAYAKRFIGLSIPVYIQTIHSACSQRSLENRLNASVNVETGGERLSKVALTRQNQEIYKHIDEDFDNDALTADDITEEAFRGIKAFFNTSATTQIAEVTQAVINYCHESVVEQSWGTTFLEMCTTWVPVQLRFVTLRTLLSRLSTIAHSATQKLPKYDTQSQYANYVLGLVSSDVNMIGLSISDLIQQILSLQSGLIIHQSKFLKVEDVDRLSMVYSNCICNLSTHIYYFDQVPDSIQEILIKIDSVLEFSFSTEVGEAKISGDKIHKLVITLLENISIMFNLLQKNTSTISRNHVNLEHWDISLAILAIDSEFSNQKSHSSLTISQKNEIQRKYLKVFRNFLNNELVKESDSRDSSEPPASEPPVNFNDDNKNYAIPDANQYITINDNFISHFLIYVDKFFNTTEFPNIENASLLTEIMKDMLSVLGVNFVSNFLPFFYHWMFQFSKVNEFTQTTKFKDSIGHVIMYHSLKSLDEMYPDELEDYACSSTFYSNLLVDIEFRKLNKVWIQDIDGEPTDEELLQNSRIHGSHTDEDGILRFNESKKALQDFVAGNSFTSKWINPNRPLQLSLGSEPHISSLNGPFSASESTNGTIGPINGNGVAESASINDQATANYSFRNHNTTLGLGNVNDITSIHSEIHNHRANVLNNGGAHGLLGSLLAHDHASEVEPKYYNLPKVSDLKDSMLEHKSLRMPSFNPDAVSLSTGPGSVLNRQMVTSDMDSILGGLDSDDDTAIVV